MDWACYRCNFGLIVGHFVPGYALWVVLGVVDIIWLSCSWVEADGNKSELKAGFPAFLKGADNDKHYSSEC